MSRVQLRAQLRSVATLVEVTGHLSPANRHQVSSHVRRFARVGGPLVLDLLEARGVDDEFVRELRDVDDLTLVVDPARRAGLANQASMPVVGSAGRRCAPSPVGSPSGAPFRCRRWRSLQADARGGRDANCRLTTHDHPVGGSHPPYDGVVTTRKWMSR